MAGARRKAKADADAQQAAQDVAADAPVPAVVQPASRAAVASGVRVRFVTVAGLDCEAVVLGVDSVDGVQLRVIKPSGLTFTTFAAEGTGPGTYQREA